MAVCTLCKKEFPEVRPYDPDVTSDYKQARELTERDIHLYAATTKRGELCGWNVVWYLDLRQTHR